MTRKPYNPPTLTARPLPPDAKKIADELVVHGTRCERCRTSQGPGDLCDEGREIFAQALAEIPPPEKPSSNG